MTEDEARAAAHRFAMKALGNATEEQIRGHLGVDVDHDLDVQNVRYFVQTATVSVPAAPDTVGE